MQGGADGSGAPTGPKNGNYKHGRHTKGGRYPPLATRGYSYAPRPEEAPRMTIKTTESSTRGKGI